MVSVESLKQNLLRFFNNRSPKINAQIVDGGRGPIVDFFDIKLGPRDTFNKINRLAIDIGLELQSPSTPIIYPVLSGGVVRIEVPRGNRSPILFNPQLADSPLKVHLGTSSNNSDVVVDLRDCPHLLIAGSTQSGKSVTEHNIIVSALQQRDSVDVFLIDPKQVEFTIYKDKVTVCNTLIESKSLLGQLLQTMADRLNILEAVQARNIQEYNAISNVPMKYILLVIDELADLISDPGFESSLAELAQKSRSVGIHLVVATQRPSTDIINGVIKANFSVRIALRVPTKVDSRVILDNHGAETLIGRGDSLLMANGASSLLRFQGAYQSINDIKRFLRTLPNMNGVERSDNEAAKEHKSLYAAQFHTIAKDMVQDLKLRKVYKANKPIDISNFIEFRRWHQSQLPSKDFEYIVNSLESIGFLERGEQLPHISIAPFVKHYYILHPEVL